MSVRPLYHQALALHRNGQLRKAEAAYLALLNANPASFNLLQLLGTLCAQQRRYAEAVVYLQRAIAIDHSAPLVHFNLGKALMESGREQEAADVFDRLIAIDPSHALAWNNKGNALAKLHQYPQAVECYQQALVLDPALVWGWNGLGCAWLALRRFADAVTAFEKALALQPQSSLLLGNCIQALLLCARNTDAIAMCDRALALDAYSPYLQGVAVHCRQKLCQWEGLAAKQQAIVTGILADKPVCLPFALKTFCDDAAVNLRCDRSFAQRLFPQLPPPQWRGERYGHGRIRVAYLAADYREHALGLLLPELLELHDRNRIESYGVSFGPPTSDPLRKRFERAFDHFIDVTGMSDDEVAQWMRAREIDVAVDLAGYTEQSRSGILARRPAPVQINYLGYAGSMGAPWIDYIMADATLIPPADEQHYSEQVVRLPHSYQVNDRKRPVRATKPTRAAVGLPPKGFVFCCFNISVKISPVMFAIWMRLLQQVENSVLWLLQLNAEMEANLRQQARLHGVDPTRLVFAPRCDVAQHLARQQCADLFLDTLPYNAHTTASDALWVGLPLLTCTGNTFASRVAASLLGAIDMPELITTSLSQYEQRALQLARNPKQLADLRKKLKKHRGTTPLFNTALAARHIETAYARMVERSEQGLAPMGFDV